MHAPASPTSFDDAQKLDRGANHLAPDCAGQNFYAIDRGLPVCSSFIWSRMIFGGWSRILIASVRWRAGSWMNWRGPLTSIHRY